MQQGEETLCLTADRILVATARYGPAADSGLGVYPLMASDDDKELLRGKDEYLHSIVIMGGSVISSVGCSISYNQLGCRVTVVEGLGRLLPNLDRELSQNHKLRFEKQGVKDFLQFQRSATCGKRRQERDLRCASGQGIQHQNSALAGGSLHAPSTPVPIGKAFFSDSCGGRQQRGPRIQVNDRFETSIPGVYAIGDVSSAIQLAHVAAAQGTACVNRMCGKAAGVDLSIVPSCVYCSPEIATVGLTEAQAKAAGIPAKTGKCTLFANARTMIANSGRSFIKLVAHGQTREILGAQMMCEHSTDMISQISVAIANHLTVEQLLLTMRPHPTFEEAISNALEELQRKF